MSGQFAYLATAKTIGYFVLSPDEFQNAIPMPTIRCLMTSSAYVAVRYCFRLILVDPFHGPPVDTFLRPLNGFNGRLLAIAAKRGTSRGIMAKHATNKAMTLALWVFVICLRELSNIRSIRTVFKGMPFAAD
jgi:hypothetical protein